MTNKINLFLHLGHAKTGTSVIQAFLNYNRKILCQDFHTLYPNFDSTDFSSGLLHNHYTYINENTSEKLIQDFSRLLIYCCETDIQNVVISCETIPVISDDIIQHEKYNEFRSWLCNEKKIHVNIIYYIRRQDNWIESAWKQWGVCDPRFLNIHQFSNSINWSHFDQLELISKQFSTNSFYIRPYEKENFPEGIIPDFLSILGINYHLREWNEIEKSNLTLNYGFNRDIVEILNRNKNFYQSIHDNRLFDFFYQYLGDNYIKKEFSSYNILTNQERIHIIERYEESNNLVKQKFFKNSIKSLFQEDLPDISGDNQYYSGLSIDNLIPIFTQLLYNIENRFSEDSKKKDQVLVQMKDQVLVQMKTKLSEDLKSNNQLVLDEIHAVKENLKNYSAFFELLWERSTPSKKNADIKKLAQCIQDTHQASYTINKDETFINVKSLGKKPYLVFSFVDYWKRGDVLVKIRIHSSEKYRYQIFFQTKQEPFFSQNRSFSYFSEIGPNIMLIPINSIWNGMLRLDFGGKNDSFQLLSVEIRKFPDVSIFQKFKRKLSILLEKST